MSNLNQPFQLKNGVTIKNRLVKASMSEQLATDNQANGLYVNLYRRWAEGGAGILLTGNVMVDPTALGAENDVVVEDERNLAEIKAWAKAGTSHGTCLIMQINHPGKQSPKDLSPEPVAPSAVPLGNGLASFFAPPRALTESEIEQLIARFARTAEIAEKAGFSGVQIHGAHGYLISQFLSPQHNQRTDKWGGSLENRSRFLMEIYRAIKAKVSPQFIVAVKLNSADFQKGGFSEQDSMQVIRMLSDEGVDFIEISGGNYESPAMLQGVKASTAQREAYFLDFATQARQVSQVPLVVTGGFRSQQAMEQAIASQQLDFVGIGKPFAIEPNLANRLFDGSYQTLKLKPIRTGLKALDSKLASVLEMGWYMHQMRRIAENKAPQPKLSAWLVLFAILWRSGKKGLRKERA